MDYHRRRFLAIAAAAGVGHTLMPGALLAFAAQTAPQSREKLGAGGSPSSGPVMATEEMKGELELATITPAMIDAAAVIAGITISSDQKQMMLEGLTSQREAVVAIRALHLPNSVAPAMVFDPVPGGMVLDTVRRPVKMSTAPDVKRLAEAAEQIVSRRTAANAADASAEETLSFATVRELAELLRARRVTSLDLTKMYLARLKKYDPRLHFVITLTEERALAQAAAADRETAAGRYKGPLHGIPWGGKDLLAVKGYRTTWGAAGFEQQAFDYDAEVVKRLDAAGAVLLAKLTMGALAQGDLWFGARTRNPWNPRQGSSGSSAGSASAVAAGCVGFAIGTETLGSISSPSTRVGATGLRPSFGLVPRTGAMALSWSMDKIGPICRAVEDCALVLGVIYGPDGQDLAVKNAAFNWDAALDWKKLRVGYIKAAFDTPVLGDMPKPPQAAGKEMDAYTERMSRMKGDLARRIYDARYADATLQALKKMGVTPAPVEMPKFPFSAIVPVLEAEGAAAFDELTRSGRDKLLTGQLPFDWPNNFRVARFYSAVDYVQAMRARTVAIANMTKFFAGFDVIVTPSQGPQLTATNLTGQPAVIVPNGIRGDDAPPPATSEDGALANVGGPGTPVSITFLGPLYSDARLAAFARAYQEATGFHRLRPKMG